MFEIPNGQQSMPLHFQNSSWALGVDLFSVAPGPSRWRPSRLHWWSTWARKWERLESVRGSGGITVGLTVYCCILLYIVYNILYCNILYLFCLISWYFAVISITVWGFFASVPRVPKVMADHLCDVASCRTLSRREPTARTSRTSRVIIWEFEMKWKRHINRSSGALTASSRLFSLLWPKQDMISACRKPSLLRTRHRLVMSFEVRVQGKTVKKFAVGAITFKISNDPVNWGMLHFSKTSSTWSF